ncbi:MAG: THUMP domain-containing class I SAM-dependent RNA methyltransferase [Phycisphaerales bacterium]
MSQIDPMKKRLTRITCSEHITPHLKKEVEGLGYEIQEEDHVAVHVGANLEDCMRLSLHLRTADHIFWLLTRFRCPSLDALAKHAKAFPWEDLIENDSYFTITSNIDHHTVDNSMYPNLLLKDQIVDRIKEKTGERPDTGPDRSQVVIHLVWKNDRAWIYLNINGVRLSDRGYRKMPHEAPMRETLAAAVLLASGYDGTTPFVNPMCGSGTLAIEAALITAGRAPGLLRNNLSCLHTALDIDDLYVAMRQDAKKSNPPTPNGITKPIIATDFDSRAIEAARKNAMTAGVEHLIDFECCDFAETYIPDEPGHVIFNPEYGLRLGETDELKETYARMGDFFKTECKGWNGHVFTGSRALSHEIRLKTSARQIFYNGQIECRLLSYELYEGSKKNSSDPTQSEQV